MSSTLSKILPLVMGLYIGKYYPQYVPLPQINRENIDSLLRRLEDVTQQTDSPTKNIK